MKQWKLEDAQLFFEQAITIARQIHKYQYALNMFDLAVVFIMRNQQQQFNQCWQEAREISLQWKYFDLLGQAEKMLGNVDYMSCNYQLAFAHYREYSHWAALQSDKIEFERALRFVLDQMFDVPDELISAILDDFIVYWIAQNWEEYPMAKTLLQEMKKLLDK